MDAYPQPPSWKAGVELTISSAACAFAEPVRTLVTAPRLLIALLLLAPTVSAQAAEITNLSYSDSRREFQWEFSWSGTIPGMTEAFAPPGMDEWNVSGILTDDATDDPDLVLDDILLRLIHVKGPHGESDQPSITFFLRNIGALAATNAATVEFPAASIRNVGGSSVHANGHVDKYAFFYSKCAVCGGAVFIVTGDHPLRQVPEPASVILLAVGICGVVRHRLRRRGEGRT
jgi:hypothetical protein